MAAKSAQVVVMPEQVTPRQADGAATMQAGRALTRRLFETDAMVDDPLDNDGADSVDSDDPRSWGEWVFHYL